MSRPHDDKVNAAAISTFLSKCPAWRLSEDGLAIERAYQFADFNAAWGFMSRTALAAERMDHHPDWRNVYHRVTVRLTTHDSGGLTARDLALAEIMEGFAATAAAR